MSGAKKQRFTRDPAGGILGGVCAGLGRRFDVDPIIPRAGAVVLAIGTSGLAVVAYLLVWALVPAAGEGVVPRERRRRGRRGSWRIALGVAMLALSVLFVFRELGLWWSDALIWPLTLACFGVALLWGLSRPPASETPEAPERADAGRAVAAPPDPDAERGEAARRFSRAGFGIALVLAAALLFLWTNGVLDAVGDAAVSALVVTIALALISAPFWWGLVRRLTVERSARIRSQERAEVAAHLHDSVLQTLAMVQRRSGEPAEVEKLARRQERELRSWLAGDDQPRPGERLADALRGAAEEVEEAHGAVVEAVVVGDAPLDPHLEALVAAAREALTNAAKFAADGGPVRLYAEIENGGARVYVDDRGPGFNPDKLPADRRGVRESIIGRMRRHGGRAEIHSRRGRGTEIELAIGEEDMTKLPSVVIVDDHAIFRAGVRAELGDLVEVLGEAESVEDAVRAIAELEPDVVLLDVHMPGGGGVEVIEQVSRARPGQSFLALSVSDDAKDVIAVVRAGARGYVTKTITGEELADAVARVKGGDAVFSPRLAGFVLDAFAGDLPAEEVDPELDLLTPREREVLRYIARGYMYKEIAQRLKISAKTVEAHVSSVLRKLQLSNRHELSAWAVNRRLID